MIIKRLRWGCELIAAVFPVFAFALLPGGLAKKLGALAGRLFFRLWGSRRSIAIENIRGAVERGALPEGVDPGETALRMFENLGVFFAELAKIYAGLGRKTLEGVAFEGIENLTKARASGRGVIFVTAHAGNWELLAIMCGLQFGSISVVARPLNNPYLNALLEKVRAKFGNRVIYKRGALKSLLRLLKGGGIAGILMDQAVVKEEGHVVEFLGAGAWTLKIPVLLARRTGAAVLPLFIRKTTEGKHEIVIHPEADMSGGSEEQAILRLNRKIEDYVRANPAQWLWIHRRWKRTQALASPRKEGLREEVV